jgi:plasmid maintenance system antidote protein VapI
MKKRPIKKRRFGHQRPSPAPKPGLAWSAQPAGRGGARQLPPTSVHPGKLLREEFMKPSGLTPAIMAKAIPRHPEFPDFDIAEQIRDLTRADRDSFLDLYLALALDRYFGLN